MIDYHKNISEKHKEILKNKPEIIGTIEDHKSKFIYLNYKIEILFAQIKKLELFRNPWFSDIQSLAGIQALAQSL